MVARDGSDGREQLWKWEIWASVSAVGAVVVGEVVVAAMAVKIYGQGPPSEKSTTTECGINDQLLAVIYRSHPMGKLLVEVDHNQLRTDNGVRDGRSN